MTARDTSTAAERYAGRRATSAASGRPLAEGLETAPLSFAQERYWYLEQIGGENAVYNVPAALRLKGELDRPALDRSVVDLCRRHEALRTAFVVHEGEPRQAVVPLEGVALETEELRVAPGDRPEEALRERLEAEARRPFDLGAGRPVRWRLFRVDERDHVLLQVVHHAVYDGWSFGVVQRDFEALYRAHHAGVEPRLPEPRLRYRDHAIQERERLSGERLERLLRYWEERLRDDPPPLDLPVDRPRPPVQRLAGAGVSARLGPDVLDRLKTLGRTAGATPFMTLAACFKALLFRYTSQVDLVVGTVVAGRRKELEDVVGCFVNTVALRTDLSGDPPFREAVRRVARTCLGALANQEAPFDRVVERLRPDRSLSRGPIFQVLFRSEDVSREPPALDGLDVEVFGVERGATYSDLDLAVAEDDDGLELRLRYDVDLFDRSTAERILRHYCNVCRDVTGDPDRRLSRIEILSAEERHLLLREWNHTDSAAPEAACVHALFEASARSTPQAVAVEDEEGAALSYAELDARAGRVAAGLRDRGLGPGHVVGICSRRSAEMLVAVLGVLKSGAAYLPIDPELPGARIDLMVRDADVEWIVVAAGAPTDALPPHVRTLRVADMLAEARLARKAEAPGQAPAREPGPDDLAYLIYTSGSTGRPKGVRVTHGSAVNFLGAMAREPGLGASDRLLAVTTLSFDIALLELMLPLAVGATVVVAARRTSSDGRKLLGTLAERRITTLQGTPATWRLLIDAGWEGEADVRVLCGGEAMSPDLARGLAERSSEVWNLYGPTEATVWSTLHRIRGDETVVPIGRPIANTRAYVLDAALDPVPIGAVGELCLGGKGVASGYHARPELTEERFVPDPFAHDPRARLYRTGDLARWRPDGTLVCLGRMDDQVKVRGFRIELGEVTAALNALQGVASAVAAVGEDPLGEKRLVAYVVSRPGASLTSSDVRRGLKDVLPDYAVPSLVVEVDAIPLNPNGKVDRSALPQLAPRTLVASRGDDPATPTEREVARTWEELLAVPGVGADDNFFELGGHSLLCMRAVYRIEERMGVRVNPRDMVLHTLRQIAADIDAGLAAAGNGRSSA